MSIDAFGVCCLLVGVIGEAAGVSMNVGLVGAALIGAVCALVLSALRRMVRDER